MSFCQQDYLGNTGLVFMKLDKKDVVRSMEGP